MKKLLFVLAACLSLVGCKTNPSIEVRYVNVFVKPPEILTNDCIFSLPPSKEVYLKATPVEREALLADYANKQTIHLGNCNEDKYALRQWVEKQEAIYNNKKD